MCAPWSLTAVVRLNKCDERFVRHNDEYLQVERDYDVSHQTWQQEDSDRTMNKHLSLISQVSHLLAFSAKKPKMHLEEGMLIISIDIDVGDRKLGLINKGENNANVNRHISEYQVGWIEELSVPLFLEMFNKFEIPVTFAVRGQLTELEGTVLEILLKSSVKHDLGVHGYYHRKFTNLCRSEAERELKMISAGMKKFSIFPRTFIFPANCVAHLDLLEKLEYKCYRDRGDLRRDSMYIEKNGRLYNVHPSLYVDQYTKPALVQKIIDICAERKLPFHMWFHLWNFGVRAESIRRNADSIFVPILSYASRRKTRGALSFETMLSAAEKVEKASTSR